LYFVGLLPAVMGAVITFAAVRSLVHPPEYPKILSQLHPDLWWGSSCWLSGWHSRFLTIAIQSASFVSSGFWADDVWI
jgi:hypothetical protein